MLRPRGEPRRIVAVEEPEVLSPPAYESLAVSEPPPAARPEPEDDGVPSSLEDAVMREISDRSPDPGGARVPASNPPPIVEPSALRKRSSNPPAVDDSWDLVEEQAPLASIPPDAVVPEAAPAEVAPEPHHDTEVEAPYSSPFALTDEALAPDVAPPPEPEPSPEPPPPRIIEPTLPLVRAAPPTVEPAPEPPVPKRSAWPLIAAFAGLGLAVGVVVQMRTGDPPVATQPTTTAPPTAPPPPSAIATATVSAPLPSATNLSDDLPPGAEVPPGYGLVEVTAPTGSRVRIDGAITGGGPLASLVAAPGYHEVRVEQDGHDTKQVIEVRAGKTTRVKSAPPP
jgi:hypothetical protein